MFDPTPDFKFDFSFDSFTPANGGVAMGESLVMDNRQNKTTVKKRAANHAAKEAKEPKQSAKEQTRRSFSYQALAERILVKQSSGSLAPFTQEDAKLLVQTMHPYTVPAGQEFITEAVSDSSFMLLILSGEVVIEAGTMEHRAQTVAVVQAGEWVGELSMLDNAPRQTSCRAADYSDVIGAVLTRQAFIEMVEENPKMAAKLALLLANQTAQRLRNIQHKVHMLTEIQSTFRETAL